MLRFFLMRHFCMGRLLLLFALGVKCKDRKGRICNFLNIFLQEFLVLVEVIILNTFCFVV